MSQSPSLANLSTQIDEIHALQSIFQSELQISPLNPEQFAEIAEYLAESHLTTQIPPFNPITLCLEFLLHENSNFTAQIYLPFEYPSADAPIIQQIMHGNRKMMRLVEEFGEYLREEFQQGEEVLFQLVEHMKEWIEENGDQSDGNLEEEPIDSPPQKHELALAGIHFHHIYADSKKQAIRKKSAQYNIKGFWKSGKPGRALIVGHKDNVQSWISDIKSLSWQKMTVRVEYPGDQLPDEVQNINSFEHLDTDGDLKREMEAYRLQKIFFELVGLENEL